MNEICNYVKTFCSGSPQFRIREAKNEQAPSYRIYSQSDLFDDLTGVKTETSENKVIRTEEQVSTLLSGDIIFSLISGNACIVSKEHEGYLYTQNYVKMSVESNIDVKFLLYLFNEDKLVRRQLQAGLQGSAVLKYTLKQLKELRLPVLPSMERQKIVGDIYLKQLKLETLKYRKAKAETAFLLGKLEEAVHNERSRL